MELIPGKQYFLNYSGEFCHILDKDGFQKFKSGLYTFVGTVDCASGKRNIFVDFSNSSNTTYVMFGAGRLDYIIDYKSSILNEIQNLDSSDPKLEKILKILK